MAHTSRVTVVTTNVGWFDQNWRYDYTVTWLGGNGCIREVKITKSRNAAVTAPTRFFLGPFFIPRWVSDPRTDLAAPTGWVLIVRANNFEFMLQPPNVPPPPPPPLAPGTGPGGGGLYGSFIPPLVPPPPFIPAPPPVVGEFTVFSTENPAPHGAFTTDHRLGRDPAVGMHSVDAPNTKTQTCLITGDYKKEKVGYRYMYTISSVKGKINQGVVYLHPDVKIKSIKINNKKWSSFRVGFDKPTRSEKQKADGKPTKKEKGILYFGSFDDYISTKDRLITISFLSKSKPGYVSVQGNHFAKELVGPVPSVLHKKRIQRKR